MDIAFDIEVHFYTKIITFLSDLWSLFCIIWLFNGLSVPGGSIWTSSWGYWPIPINSEFVDLLLDIQQKLTTNKEKIHIFCSERIPKIIFYFEEIAEKNIWQHAYFVKGIEPRIIFLQGIDLFSAKLQSISLGKIVHKGIFSEFDFEVNAPRKQSRKSSFRNILKSFFWIQKTIKIPSQNQPLQHSSRSICSKHFESLPLQTFTDTHPLLWRWGAPVHHDLTIITTSKQFCSTTEILPSVRS